MHPLLSAFSLSRHHALSGAVAALVAAQSLSSAALGQTPAAASTPPASASPTLQSRLDALDATYKANLRRLHLPVLQNYLKELELLRQQLAARARLSDAKTVEKEIEQVKQLIATGSAMPYTALMPSTAPAASPAPAPGSGAPPAGGPSGPGPGPASGAPGPNGRRPGLVLQANAARVQGVPADASAKTLSLGVAEWSVPALPAGSYDLNLVFAAPKLEGNVEIRALFAGNDLSTTLNADRATGSDQTFRIFRVGRITLSQDATNELLQLRSNLPLGQMLVKSVIFAEPRKVK